MKRLRSTGVGLALATVLGFGLAGCGSRGGDPADTIGNIFAYHSTNPPPATPTAAKPVDVNCPVVQIADGHNAYRVYAGREQTSETVRYQYSFDDLARDCVARGDKLDIRVGISGYVLDGPAGGSGSFTVPVKVVIQRESDQKPVVSKVYRLAATIPTGQTQAAFSTVTEPLSVPYTGTDADSAYSIFVGFDDPGADRPAKATRGRRARR